VIGDLAQARPGIRIDELASLLNIDVVTARLIVDRLSVEIRSAIDFSSR
jgi:predicted transcriptional regulator